MNIYIYNMCVSHMVHFIPWIEEKRTGPPKRVSRGKQIKELSRYGFKFIGLVKDKLGGGFNYFLFSSLFGEMIQSD